MKINRTNYYFLLFCVHLYFTVCSMDKDKIEKKQSIDNKNIKETEQKEDKVQTQDAGKRNKKYYERKSYASKEDIPKDYLDILKKHYNIREDQGEYFDEIYDSDDDYDYMPSYVQNVDDIYSDNELYDDKSDGDLESDKESDTLKDNATNTEDSSLNKTCKVCEIVETDKKMRIDSIKNMILSKLGFSSQNLPNMTGKTIPRIPSIQRLIDEHEMQGDAPYNDPNDYLPEDEFYGQVRKAYTIAQKPPDEFKIHVPGGAFFDLPESVTSRKITDASLWIYIEPSAIKRKQAIAISVYIIPLKAKPEHLLKGPVRYKKTEAHGWIEFKFSHIVHHWAKQPAENRGIVIHAFDEAGNNLAVTPGHGHDEKFIPMLEMTTMAHRNEHPRGKRSLNNICTEHERQEACCRYPLRVDFVQFGWDWVIAPTGYMANFCSGECKFRHMENNPQAYLIQQTPDGNGPCCTPSKYMPLAMLYFDHAQTVLYTHMQKMIVLRCGCA